MISLFEFAEKAAKAETNNDEVNEVLSLRGKTGHLLNFSSVSVSAVWLCLHVCECVLFSAFCQLCLCIDI